MELKALYLSLSFSKSGFGRSSTKTKCNSVVESVIDISERRIRSAESAINVYTLRIARRFEHKLRVYSLVSTHCDTYLDVIRYPPNQAIIRFTKSA